MSEAKWIPGPWVFHAHNGEVTDSSAAENLIADVQLEDWHKLGAGYANAHLIAAAPSMADALMQWRNAEAAGDAEELENARKARDAALAQAMGEQ